MLKKVILAGIGFIIVAAGVIYCLRPLIADKIREARYEESVIYYTQILEQGTMPTDSRDYVYHTIGVNDKGDKKNLEFYGMDGNELRLEAYLRINYTDEQGVIGWQSVNATDIPENIMIKLNEIANK